MFVDKVKIRVKAGMGKRVRFVSAREICGSRGPDGGDGGKGGDIVLMADKNLSDLSDFYYQPRVVAKHGVHGRGKNCFGRSAKTFSSGAHRHTGVSPDGAGQETRAVELSPGGGDGRV